jgi:hypothetical protein
MGRQIPSRGMIAACGLRRNSGCRGLPILGGQPCKLQRPRLLTNAVAKILLSASRRPGQAHAAFAPGLRQMPLSLDQPEGRPSPASRERRRQDGVIQMRGAMADVLARAVAGGNLSTGVCEDWANRWVIAVFAVGSASAYLPAWTDRNELWAVDGWLGVGSCRFGRRPAQWQSSAATPRHHRYLQLHSPPELPHHSQERCCGRSSARNATPTAPAHHGSFRASFEP